MPDLWMPGATRLDIGDHAPTDGGPAKAIAHITWDRNATAKAPAALVPYENLRDYFGKNPAGKAVAPHILWDPFTGRVTQFVPADCRSKSLADAAGGTRTNRAGSTVIQVEALFFPYCVVDGKTYARLADTPCKGWSELHAWVRSWGVPDAWPMGRPTNFTPHRSETTWEKAGGWYAHAHVPENDHQDPGSWPAFTTEEEDPMAGITKQDIYDAVWKTDKIAAPADAKDVKTNPTWQPQSVIKDVQARIRSMDKRLAAQTAAITSLAKLAGKGVDTAAVVAAVEKAIEDAVIDVNINTKESHV
ncbi:hypothetical protein [Streptomyces drozdowiczii]|uniref:hypothetical protein n=1 Tax=Streptomyces drozdowiczii TaxID=202862 RepID=UPI00403C3E74